MSKIVNWDDQRTFLAVLEDGSYSAAARRLGVTQPTVRARIEALERDLGVTLFVRSANGLAPTDQARSLGPSARAMAHASDAFVRGASADRDQPSGTVRLSVSEFMGVEVVPPMIAGLLARFPALQIELDLSNGGADLLEQQADIAVRMFSPSQGALVAKKIGHIPLGFYAAPDYVARHGAPDRLEALVDHRLIGPDRSTMELTMARRHLPALERRDLALRSDSHPANLALARAGAGIAVVQRPTGDRDPKLVRILPDLEFGSREIWIVTHESLRAVPRIAAVFDHLVAEFARYVAS
jgi:DNA-binding transcriptional LysR family regulator